MRFFVSLAPLPRSGLSYLLHAGKLALATNVGGVARLGFLHLLLSLGCRHDEVFQRSLLLLQHHIDLEVKHCASQAVANAACCQAVAKVASAACCQAVAKVAKVANAVCCHLSYRVCLYSHSVSQHNQ